MRTVTLAAILTVAMLTLSLGVSVNPANALFESKSELVSKAQISMDKAVEIALKAVPGKAVEAEIEKEDGRAAYEIEIIDTTNTERKVHVDARTGDVMKLKKD